MVAAPMLATGPETLFTAGSQALEFFGSYAVGRAFFFGDSALHAFTRVLKLLVLLLTAFAVIDMLFERYFISELMADIFNMPKMRFEVAGFHFYRTIAGFNFFRAASTFDHPILFGAFCSTAAAILLYAERDLMGRYFVYFVCATGCVLSMSSAPMLSIIGATSIYVYDRAFKRQLWRWKLLTGALLAALFALFVLSNDPLSWVLRNLTLDPQSGYFRLLIWNAAIDQIAIHPVFGSFVPTGDKIVDGSVDCLWLGKALGYGLPMIVLLLCTVLGAVMPFRGQSDVRAGNHFIDRMCTGLSLALALLGFISLTVYFWNGIWLFSALCVGNPRVAERILLSNDPASLFAYAGATNHSR